MRFSREDLIAQAEKGILQGAEKMVHLSDINKGDDERVVLLKPGEELSEKDQAEIEDGTLIKQHEYDLNQPIEDQIGE